MKSGIIIIILGLLHLLALVCGSFIHFQSSSNAVTPLISKNLTLTCSLQDSSPDDPVGKRSSSQGRDLSTYGDISQNMSDDESDADSLASHHDNQKSPRTPVTNTADDIVFVTSMVVTRDGVDVATLSEHFPVKALSRDVIASGHLTGQSGEKGVIQLTWPHPTLAEAGVYTCEVATLGRTGHHVVFRQSLSVSGEQIPINDVVDYLQKIQIEREEMQATIQSMNRTINSLIESEEILKADNVALNQSLETLRNVARKEPDIFFTAILTSERRYLKGQAVIFDKIVSDQGSAYNSRTGEFTTPTSGFYLFEIHGLSSLGKYGAFALFSNSSSDNRIVSLQYYGGEYRESSNSVIVRLNKGEVLSLKCLFDNSQLTGDNGDFRTTTFSGRLISLA